MTVVGKWACGETGATTERAMSKGSWEGTRTHGYLRAHREKEEGGCGCGYQWDVGGRRRGGDNRRQVAWVGTVVGKRAEANRAGEAEPGILTLVDDMVAIGSEGWGSAVLRQAMEVPADVASS